MESINLKTVIGPIMVGPSSSHTAGALRIAYMARKLCTSAPSNVTFNLLGSFAHTLTGHGTDKALVGGILGFEADDIRIKESFTHAKRANIKYRFHLMPDAEFKHPNTVDVHIIQENGEVVDIRGESIGGGAAVITRINNIDVRITGTSTSIVVKQMDKPGVLAHITNILSAEHINIATVSMFREKRGSTAYTIMETDEQVDSHFKKRLIDNENIIDVTVIEALLSSDAQQLPQDFDVNEAQLRYNYLDFTSGKSMLNYCYEKSIKLSDAIFDREIALQESHGHKPDHMQYLRHAWDAMKTSAYAPINNPVTSMGSLLGGEAQKLANLEKPLCDPLLSSATKYSMAVLETNAGMGVIVAAPTAGASGVIPGTLLAVQEAHGFSDEEMCEALGCAAAVGFLITRNATVSGAEGGCQAEVGSASAMAAAAIAQLMGASPQTCLDAAANAMTNLMGLVCDPIAGLVEVPCQKRNAAGASVALVSAQIALAGIENLVDFDETVEAMYKVGVALPFELRETALGGLAATPSACAHCIGCS